VTTRTAQTILCLAAGATVLAQTGCSRTPPPAAATKPSTTTAYPPKPASQVLVLQLEGTPPRDTTVNVPSHAKRVVVLRHGAPDNITFAEVTFPPAFSMAVATRCA
jgi:hypothetical protein